MGYGNNRERGGRWDTETIEKGEEDGIRKQ